MTRGAGRQREAIRTFIQRGVAPKEALYAQEITETGGVGRLPWAAHTPLKQGSLPPGDCLTRCTRVGQPEVAEERTCRNARGRWARRGRRR
jgi:hypothetical protein